MKYDAVSLSWAGDKYLGRSYQEMDCQAFVERCMADVGYSRNLAGSNAWYRAMTWTGTPEECVKTFGSVPKGAFLFILSSNGKEPEKYKKDGIGNASHIGLKTGRNDGAIHSSSSKGKVCTSVFKDKTIPNGGWNRVGLLDVFDYGTSVNWMLEHIGLGQEAPEQPKEGQKGMRVTVYAENGQPVNLRKGADKKAELLAKIPVGTEAELLEPGGDWSKISVFGRTGWMMTQFLSSDDDFSQGDLQYNEGGSTVQLTFSAEELSRILPILEKAVDQIVKTVGRG